MGRHVQVLTQLHVVLTARGLSRFQCVIVNHGSYRNHAHLHFKVRFPPHIFEAAVRQWSTREQVWISVSAFHLVQPLRLSFVFILLQFAII
jgi:hypothetical protein